MTNLGTPEREWRPKTLLPYWSRRIAVPIVLVGAIYLAVRWLVPTPQERLAVFDAARAVPDQDNAALIYAELLQGGEIPPPNWVSKMAPVMEAIMDPISLRESHGVSKEIRELALSEGISDPNAAQVIALRPWRSAECPELRRWLDKHDDRMDKLQEAARKPSCYFPLSPTSGRMGLFDVPVGVFRQNALLLRYAANNDFGEGDIDGALAKYQSLLLLGRHFRAQPRAECLSISIACEAMALHRLAEFVVEGDPSDRHLQELAVSCQDLDDKWELLKRDITHVRNIFSGLLDDRRPLRFRMALWYSRIRSGEKGWLENTRGQLYHRMLSERRGLRILIALRRFKDRAGQWPESLDPIAPSLPPEALIDPSSGGSYVYRCSEQGFLLYSIGHNRIDENGRHKWNGPDDWPIWPPRGRSAQAEPHDTNGV